MGNVFCHVTYGPVIGDGAGNNSATYSGWAFNTDQLAMVQVSGTWRGALLDQRPPDVYLADGAVVWYLCGLDKTATLYKYRRAGETFTVDSEPNSGLCGYVPPDTRTCLLIVASVTTSYDRATVTCSNYVGPLEYSLDGGANRQTSPEFKELSAGSYTVTVYDLGATMPGCNARRQFTIAATPPAGDVATIAALPAFCFAGNPVVLDVRAAAAYHEVLVQVYVESEHRSGNFQRAYEAKRRSDSQRVVRLDVADILRSQLDAPLQLAAGWQQLRQPVRNWFVRVADVLPQTNQPGTWVTSTNGVVLMGGLSPEYLLAGRDYWGGDRAARQFHTWQPLSKTVGPAHLELLTVLLPDTGSHQLEVHPYDETGQPLLVNTRPVPAPVAAPVSQNPVVPPALASSQRVRLMQLSLDVASYPGATQLVLQLSTGAGLVRAARGLPWVLTVDAKRIRSRQLIFQGSLAGYDTLSCAGKQNTKLSLGGATVDVYQPLSVGMVATSRARSWPATPAVPTSQLSTGWLSRAWLTYVQEAVQPGRLAYLYEAGQARPIVITTKELPVQQETESMAGATLEYRPALVNEYYSAAGSFTLNTQAVTPNAGN